MARQDLGKIISEITEINATVDNGVGVPSATATITGTATEKIVNIDFKNLKGDKGDKPENGVDYFTPEDKKQFTAETVKLVTDEGTKQTGLVGEKGVAETGKLTAEGNKQINLVIAEANKVIEQLKSLIEGNPETSNAQTLSGKSRVEFERDTQALAGKYTGNFPLSTAVKDAVYLVPATGKFYVCTQAYNGTSLSAPNSNFEELSVFKNRDRLDNLYSSYQNILVKKDEKLIIDVNLEFEAYLVVAAHESDGVILNALLTGSKRFGNKLTISSCSSNIKIIQGTSSPKLAIESNIYGYLAFYFIPLGFFDKRINLEIQKN